jgi:CheY-like chemotaxis protein/HPt (histidine-containing phosphotransfer) domain-containing protein
MPNNLKILLAEDNKFNQQLVIRILANIGYNAVLAENGLEVLNLLNQEEFDVILMDIQMPEMDGLTTTKLIRANYNKEKQPMIVALTADTSKGDTENYLKVGMDSVLTKPIQIDELIATLDGFSTRKSTSPQASPSVELDSVDQAGKTFSDSILQELLTLMGSEGKEVVDQLIDLYKKEAPEIIEQLNAGRIRNDIEGLLRSLHKLRGSSGQTGGVRLGHLCQTLETELKQSNTQNLDKSIEAIEEENKRLSAELENFRRGLS